MSASSYLLASAAHGEGVWSVLTSGPHLLAELIFLLVFDVLIGALLWPLAKRWLKRHDLTHHDRPLVIENLISTEMASRLTQRVERLEAANVTRLTLDDE